jgi:hypothetical protein
MKQAISASGKRRKKNAKRSLNMVSMCRIDFRQPIPRADGRRIHVIAI